MLYGTSAQADKLTFGAKARAHFAGFIGTSEDVPLTKQTCAEVSYVSVFALSTPIDSSAS
jgi:hypothetical protein